MEPRLEESGENSWGKLSRQRWKVSQEQKITYGRSDKRFRHLKVQAARDTVGEEKEGLQIFRELENHIFKSVDYTETELKFKRVDSDVADAFKAEENDESKKEVLEKIMREAVEDDKLTVNVAKLDGIDVPAILTFDEQMRRFKENSRMWGNEFDMPIPATITLNIASSIIDKLISLPDEEKSEFAKHIYDLAELQQGSLPQNRMAEFIRRSYKFM